MEEAVGGEAGVIPTHTERKIISAETSKDRLGGFVYPFCLRKGIRS